MKINIYFCHKVIKTNVIVDGVPFDLEVTDEQFARIEESFLTGRFKYMSDDETLADICAPIYEEADKDARNEYGDLAKELTAIVEYPIELTENTVTTCGGIKNDIKVAYKEEYTEDDKHDL